MRFEFATSTRIVFGAGTLREIAPAAREMGARALVVTGRSLERAAPLVADLKKAGVDCAPFAIAGEPTTQRVREGVQFAREERCDLVISFGGGSPIDAG